MATTFDREGDAPVTRVLIAGGGTGGHLMPALAIADAIVAARPGTHVALAGARRGVEAQLLPGRGYPYTLLPVEPIYRRQWWKNFRWPLTAVQVIHQTRTLLAAEHPTVVVGTGGYASGPVVWMASRRGIPTAIQEQNAWPGFATRRLAGLVKEIYLGVPEARAALQAGPETAVLDTGNPIVPPDRGAEARARARSRFFATGGVPVVVVTGGSQGSLALNQQVAQWLDGGGGQGLQLLWAAGRATVDQFRRYHKPPFIQVFEFINPMSDAWAIADLAVARAGMMTIAELCAWGIPSILVPLPTAAQDHQTANAQVMADAGAAIHLPQSRLGPGALGGEIARLIGDPVFRTTMAECAMLRGKPDAAARIAARILALSDS